MRVLLAACVIIATFFATAGARPDTFPIDRCTPPAANSGKIADVDQQCGLAGQAPEAEHQAQNQAKNNLCVAGTGRPVPLTKQDFMRLQQAADRLVAQGRLEYGERDRLPKDRQY